MLNSKDMEYMVYTLGDIGVIELLLRFRYKYDPYMYNRPNNNFLEAGDVTTLSTEAIALFQDLDYLIEKAGLNERQMNIVDMVQEGYSLNQIAIQLNLNSNSAVSNSFKTICKKMIKQNLREWRRTIYVHLLGLKTKQCSKCKEQLPATVEFYSDNDLSKDGFHSVCKECRK